MRGASQRRVVAKFRIAGGGGDLKARLTDLMKHGQRETPFLLEPHAPESARAAGPRASATHRARQRAPHPRAHRGPQGRGDGHLAVRHFAQRPAVPPGNGDRAPTLLGKARPGENEHAGALGDHRSQLSPGRSARLGACVIMLERLIRPRIGDASSMAVIDLRRLSFSSPSR